MRKAKPEEKILVVKCGGDKEMEVTVPSDSKVTFGPAIPAPSKGYVENSSREYALRIYNGATEKSGLLAVFTNVREFREESIRVRKLVIRESGKAVWQSDENGFEVTKSVKRDRKMIGDGF